MPEAMSEPSAMMAQYNGVRDRYPGHIILFRVGDFFESFGPDAETLARELDIVLTSRQNDASGQRIPMAGVPQHALETYLSRLVRKGHRVVVCDQVEDPKMAKGLIERAVTRVVTPGTVVEDALLPPGRSNFLAAVAGTPTDGYVVVLVEVSTAEVNVRTYPPSPFLTVIHEIALLRPSEVLIGERVPAGEAELAAWHAALPSARIVPGVVAAPSGSLPPAWASEGEQSPIAAEAFGMAAAYVAQCAPTLLSNLSAPVWHDRQAMMSLDITTLRHLEVTEPMNPALKGSKTLLDVLDKAESPAGKRTLTAWLTNPLANVAEIERRLEAVDWFVGQRERLPVFRARIHQVSDLSRLASRVLAHRASPRDLRAIGRSLESARELRGSLTAIGSETAPSLVTDLSAKLSEDTTLPALLLRAIPEDASSLPGSSGALDPEAFPDLKEVRAQESASLTALTELEAREGAATGIKSLKIGYTQVFGYYFEVTRPNLAKVPTDRWKRKQTLANAERFTSEELLAIENRLLSIREEATRREAELWNRLVAQVAASSPMLRETGEAVGQLDTLSTLAHIARSKGWVRPKVGPGVGIRIREGRHPVLEETLGPAYVPNDVELGEGSPRLLLLTGPNMAGKSTYMRMVGLLVYLAQCGSYVPARYAEIGVVNHLATRMGFTDETGQGKSSFMVEMSEVAQILSHSDASSLILLDEVGRGTSTSDGLALAWAIIHHVHDRVRARTIVATHYHQLADLVSTLPSAKNAHLGVLEKEGEITFLRTLLPGATNKSYGIHVAKLAGLPPAVTKEATALLRTTEEQTALPSLPEKGRKSPGGGARYTQALLLHDEGSEHAFKVLSELKSLDVHSMTPIEALNRLNELVERARKVPNSSGGRDQR
jgi:DNA mismatch repair protein MutS